jgi:hypothetical protein
MKLMQLTLAATSLLFLSVSSWTLRPTTIHVRHQRQQRQQYAVNNRITSPIPFQSSSYIISLLHQSAAPDQSVDTDVYGASSSDPNNKRARARDRLLDLPWSDIQEWALRDQFPRYTVQIPVWTGYNPYDQDESSHTTMKVYTLWRTMSQEVTELTGYPIPFLQERLRNVEVDDNGAPGAPLTVLPSSEILPFLDEFEFESAGGLSGRVYGVAGVADGTRIQTTPVGNVQITVPRGFVRTADGSVIYELGRPRSNDKDDSFSLSSMSSSASARSKALRAVQEEASAWAGSLSNVGSELKNRDGDTDADLVRLGGLAAVVLSGALAVDLLSHHLTINMFWV